MKIAPLPTTFVTSERLSSRAGTTLCLATETFQHTGSFKFRPAYHVASHVQQPRIVCASSGNFGQAIALASRLFEKVCTVVMPASSARIKIERVREAGATVDLIDTRQVRREDRVRDLTTADTYVASAYDDPLVIEGNATLGEELAARGGFDVVVVPIGGGGLASGVITGLRRRGCDAPVFAAEPERADDAARSFLEKRRVFLETEPDTIADGARTRAVGVHNWAVLEKGLAGVVTVREEQIGRAVAVAFHEANLKLEPTAALGLAAALSFPERFATKRVLCVCTGGNVDADVFVRLVEAHG